jgi:hypothetical protein
MDTNTSVKESKKRGPKPKGYEDTHILIPPYLLEWAKDQPEGFAGLVRALLRMEHERRTMATP